MERLAEALFEVVDDPAELEQIILDRSPAYPSVNDSKGTLSGRDSVFGRIVTAML
jgi:hypothetical protein